ncbi:ABC transporter permease [Cellulomonas soli]|uniref:ABC transporter permease n=1 Tax=Cellulomonas soli TaxID=931535 RepID=UPI003F83598C
MPQLSTILMQPERARTHGRAGWVSLLGLVLVPLVVGGLLTWALWQPTEHLDRMQAAVVNLDTPVQLNGQTVPLGRQLTSALVTSTGSGASEDTDAVPDVAGSSSTENFTWVITDEEDAAEGLVDGRYATVVTIPSDFSAAATSAAGGDASAAVQATIDIATSERSRLVDSAVSQAVTSTAVSLLNTQLTNASLNSVFLSFTTLHDSLGQASDGAAQVADGAGQLADGTTQLAAGTVSLADGMAQLASGADGLAQGVGALTNGADDLADGLDQIAAQTSSSAQTATAAVPQAQQLGAGMDALNAGINGSPGVATGVSGLAQGTAGVQQTAAGVLDALHAATQACLAGVPDTCQAAANIVVAQQGTTPVDGHATLTALSAQVAAGAAALNTSVNVGSATTPPLTSSVTQLTAGVHQLVDGVSASATGLGTLSGYLQQSADGAGQLADGAGEAAEGAAQLASGMHAAATGATDLSTGAAQLGSGASDLSSGTDELASGLDQAVEQVPTYTDDEAQTMADVLGTPVVADDGEQDQASLFGSTSVPFLATVALWLGALATFVVIGAVGRKTLGSTQPSAVITLQQFAPGALVGILQGLAITAVMAGALDLTPGGWVAFAAVAVLAGVAFAAVNQGLVAVLGGIGRFVSVVIAVVGLATAVISTVPPVLVDVAGVLPLNAALDGLQGVVLGDGGVGGAIVLLLVWMLFGLALTMSAVARRRVVPAGQLARWTRAA